MILIMLFFVAFRFGVCFFIVSAVVFLCFYRCCVCCLLIYLVQKALICQLDIDIWM